jgi:putative DNA primase/helicase
MLLNNSAEIAAFPDGVTSPTGFVMDGEEFVMVALPRPWPRQGNIVLCTSPHELDALGAIIVPIPMPTKAEVEKWRVFLKDAASKDPSCKYYPPYPTREEIEDWRALSKDRSRPTEERQQFAGMADGLETELRRVAYTAPPHDFASWSQEKKNQWCSNASAAHDELNKPPGNSTPPYVAPGEPTGREDISPEFSEDRLALRFAERHGSDLRYVAAWSKWLAWTGTHWEIETTLLAFHMARKICREAAAECNKPAESKAIAKAKTVVAVENLARSDRRIAAIANQWDADQSLLNMRKMSINLSAGVERPNNPLDYCTKITGAAAAPEGTPCPMWSSFLNKAMGDKQELIDYLQRVCGYCLTGFIKEHALFFLYGTGANGKSVFINTLRGIFGTHHTTAPIETFTVATSTQHPTDLAGLRGARLVTAVETEEGRTWAESKLKAITGGDEISARFMRQDFFCFTPSFKLMIGGNHKPRLRSVDEAMRRRFHLIPFAVTVPLAERDKDLAEKLKAEWPAILRWMIDGCLIWQRDGLNPPQAVIDATNKYLETEDSIGTWIEDRCECKISYQDTSASLFASWKAWAELNGEFVGSQKQFAEKLQGRGMEQIKIGNKNARGFRGIHAIKTEAPPPSDRNQYD